MSEQETGPSQRVVHALWGYAAGQSDLGREFGRRIHLHTTDSVATVEILRAEERGAPLTPARLATRLGLTSGATSTLLNRLEEAGHVTRRRGHTDRRLVTLHSTPSLTATAEAFFAPLHTQLDEMMRGYSPAQLTLIEEFLTAMRAIVDSYVSPHGPPAQSRSKPD